jgi:hypothetical protein
VTPIGVLESNRVKQVLKEQKVGRRGEIHLIIADKAVLRGFQIYNKRVPGII